MNIFYRLKKFLRTNANMVFAGVCIFMGAILAYTLIRYSAHSSSLFYFDNTLHISIAQWLANSYTALAFLFFGMSTFLLPCFLFYSASICAIKRLWAHEWDRWLASILFLVNTSFIGALMPTFHWRATRLDGGILGTWFAHHCTPMHPHVQWIIAGMITFACLIIITRMKILLPFAYAWRLFGAWITRIHFGTRIMYTSINLCFWCARQAHRFITWCVQIVYPSTWQHDQQLGLTVEQQEELISLRDIVHDVFWKHEKQKNISQKHVSHDLNLGYELPKLTTHATHINNFDEISQKELQEQAHILEQKLLHFNIQGTISAIKVGPVLTCFEYKPAIDTKLSRISALEDDLALALQATSVRVVAPIPGTDTVGFEVAHNKRRTVLCSQVMQHEQYQQCQYELPLIIGVDIIGNPIIDDLTKMPHLLIAGSTGSGKSVLLNTMLVSLLCKKTPDELSIILIDPKRLEFAAYADISHLLFPIINTADRAVTILQWLTNTMNSRYEQLAKINARNIADFHAQGGLTARMSMPYIIVVIDELADLMISAGKHVESALTRVAQMARAAGIHLIVATQRPSVDIITGIIKANFPTRIALRVASAIDSRTIIDVNGAEKLLGRGDLLMINSQSPQLQRAHATYVSDSEILHVVQHIKRERKTHYISEELLSPSIRISSIDPEDQYLYKEILEWLKDVDEVSISLLQRRFRIGYNRSARLIQTLEQQGKIISHDGEKTRRVVRSE